MALNPIVQRALQSRFQTSAPTTSVQEAEVIGQQKQMQAQFQKQAGAWNSATSSIPGLSAGGSSGGITANSSMIDRILATIRKRESGNNYTARNPVSSASGAYQFIDSTWRGLGGQGRAYMASAAEQDRIARAHVQSLLSRYGNTLEAVPAAWYTGTYKGAGKLNYNPGGPGNPLTVQQYVDRWLKDYNSW